MIVMTNSHIHQRGIGLFISRRSPSHTWPVVLSLRATPLVRAVIHNSSTQAMMLTMLMPAT